MTDRSHAAGLAARIADRSVAVGVIGLGYVGLPLALAIADKGVRAIGFDIDPAKVAMLNAGRSYIGHLDGGRIAGHVAAGRFRATADFAELAAVDVVLVCVPTPLTAQRDPDLRFVVASTEAIAATLRPGQMIVLESTSFPGTTRDVVKPILERGGLASGRDFFLVYSAEREDPGNPDFTTSRIPKVVGGDGPDALTLGTALYATFVERVVPVASPEVAEAVKLTENIFRAVNIALVNELKVVYDAMGIDVWQVIEAARTKPFGFMAFWPGPGLGGHCIPIDPFYLTWKAREFGVSTRFIELAGEINTVMPGWVVDRAARALDRAAGIGLSRARVLIAGVAYKKNVDDTRESPALRIMDLLRARGTEVAYHDPFVPRIPRTREHPDLEGMASRPWTAEELASHDLVLVVTDHDRVDWRLAGEAARLIVDTRDVMARAEVTGPKIVKA
jgi:UDP-N-acetyl-D-glucosamine dehydrogenase